MRSVLGWRSGCMPIHVRRSRLLNLMRWRVMLVVKDGSPCVLLVLEMGLNALS